MLNKINYILSILFVLQIISCGNSNSKNNTVPDVFPITELKEYYIECNLDEFNSIFKNYKENTYIAVSVSYKGEKHTAKIRVRGDTSREDPKKSLKVKFDSTSFSDTEMVFNLNAEYSDKTIVRQYLSSKFMQQNGQICFNSEPVKVFLNGNYFGIYLKVENIDKNFLKRNGLSAKNNLYKATKDGACMSIFDDIEVKWEKKTNKKGDFSDLKQLIEQINSVPDDEFYEFIKANFEYESLVNLLSLNMMLSNGSTYYHNYYLYHDLHKTGKWQIFPWDMDKSLSYYNWMPYTYHRTSSEWESDNPLVERSFICEPIFKDIQKRVKEMHENNLNNASLSPIIDKLITLLEPYADLDSLDKIKSKDEWLKNIKNEKNYFDNHFALLQKQFNEQPLSFNVHRFTQTQTGDITFTWDKSKHQQNKAISYILTYGTDFLLLDSSKTTFISNITDTFYVLKNNLNDGKYYWKVTAFDGSNFTDGFNTKNIFISKKPTISPASISNDVVFSKEKSPYLIEKDLLINPNAKLTIDPGVEIFLKQDVNITCHGNIVAEGTKEEPISFTPDNSSKNWGHIYFYEKAEKGVFKHCIIKEGIVNFKQTEILIDNCQLTIQNKNLVDGEKRAALIWGSKGKLTLTNSTLKGNGKGEGMVIYFVDAITENCSFDNMPDAIEYIQTDHGVIRNNLVKNSPDDAIDLNACNNVMIEGNFLINNADKGVSIGTEQYGPSRKNIHVRNNVFIGNKSAVSVKDSSTAYIYNNTFYKNKRGVFVYKKREDYKIGGEATVYNNIFYDCAEMVAYADDYSKILVESNLVNNKGIGGNNLHASPEFVDTENNNFFLKENSPAIHSGKSKETIGAFYPENSLISIVAIHPASNEQKNSGDWIELQNNYNIDLDLSAYKIIIEKEGKEKEFVFPLNYRLKGLSNLFLVENYSDFITVYGSQKTTLGELPKLNLSATKISLFNKDGVFIDSYEYPEIKQQDKSKGVIISSNRINDATQRVWQTIEE